MTNRAEHKAQENSDYGLLCLITAYQNLPLSQGVPCYAQPAYGTSRYLCGCEEINGYGYDTYSDYHCATCHREAWTRRSA